MSKIRLFGDSSGFTEIAAANAAGNGTVTLPNSGTIVTNDSAGSVGVTSVVTDKVKVGAAVTITESGINAVGVISATSFVGSGSGISGISTAASQIIEQFFVPCNGGTVATAHATRTVENVTSSQDLTTSHSDLTGSTITYRPPTGTTTVVYRFYFHHAQVDTSGIAHYKFFIGSDEVTYARVTNYQGNQDMISFEWPITIGGSADTDSGVLASWNTDLVLKMQTRDYGSSHDCKVHTTNHWDGSGTDQFHMPCIGITAIGTPS